MTIEELQKYIDLFRKWICQRAVPLMQAENPSLVANWRDEINTAERLLDAKPEVPIALLESVRKHF